MKSIPSAMCFSVRTPDNKGGHMKKLILCSLMFMLLIAAGCSDIRFLEIGTDKDYMHFLIQANTGAAANSVQIKWSQPLIQERQVYLCA